MQIVKVEAPKELATERVNAVKEAFRPYFEAMGELEPRYKALTDIKLVEPTKEQCKEARAVRLALVKLRTGTKGVHKEQKEDPLAECRYLDGMKKAQELASTDREAPLMEIEKHWENMELERIANLTTEREQLLSAVGVEVFPNELGKMEEAVWDVYYDGAYQDKKRRDEAKRIADAEEIVRERAAAEERERVQKEIDRLKAEALERDRIEAEERAERLAVEAEAQAERDRIEMERIAKEEAEQEARDMAEEKRLAVEAEERRDILVDAEKKRLELEELNAKQEAKLEAERAEKERLQQIEVDRLAAAEKAAKEKKFAEEVKAKRIADESHRCDIQNEISNALVKIVGPEGYSGDLLTALINNKIPHVSINY